MKLLIVGGSGHVSGTLALAALGGGHDVWTITRGKRTLPDGVKSLIVDRHDYETLTTIVAGAEIVWDLVVDCICYDVPDIRQDIETLPASCETVRFHLHRFCLCPGSTDVSATGEHRSLCAGWGRLDKLWIEKTAL
jgi:hypothetical protein